MKIQPDKCLTCHQPIKWIALKGKPHPLNTQMLYVSPNGSGKRLMLFQSDGSSVNGFLCKPGDPGAQGGCQSHFATCKQATQWRDNPRRKQHAAAELPKAQTVEEEQMTLFDVR